MVTQELQIVRFHPKEADDKLWDVVIPAFQTRFKERRPDDPVPPPQFTRRNLEMMEEDLFSEPAAYLIYSSDETFAGYAYVAFARPDSDQYEERKHVCFFDCYVLPEFRRQGIGTSAFRFVVEQARERDTTVLEASTDIADGQAFVKHFGAEVALDMRTNRAYIEKIDWQMVDDWRSSGQARNPDTKIVCFDGLYSEDDTELAEFCRVFSAALKEMPMGEVEGMVTDVTPKKLRENHEQTVKRGYTSTTMVTLESDGRLSGVTEVFYHPERDHVVGQGITGVPMDERGRGLGKWLKAEMLVYIKERYPDAKFIDTGNAESNAPMRSINERVGFKLYSHNMIFKLSLEDTMKYLDPS